MDCLEREGQVWGELTERLNGQTMSFMGDNFESEQKDWGTALWLFSQPHSQRQACVPTDRFIGTHLIGWVLGLADDPVPLGGLAAVLLVSALPLILPTLPTHPAACNLLNLGNFQKKVKEDLATETVLLHIITSLIADSGLPFEPVNPRTMSLGRGDIRPCPLSFPPKSDLQ